MPRTRKPKAASPATDVSTPQLVEVTVSDIMEPDSERSFRAPEDKVVEVVVNRGGRPPKLTLNDEILRAARGLGRLQATTRECAAFIGCSEVTWLKFVNEHAEVKEAIEAGKGSGMLSLRRNQMRLSETNAAMAIFLGKNLLKQTDKVEHEHSGAVETTDARERLAHIIASHRDAGSGDEGSSKPH